MTARQPRRDAAAAALGYTVLAVLFTWPLARDLAHSVPGDFGDPLLNCWILAWDATHLLSSSHGWWNANIFYPQPLALAYSDHLAAQALQILPLYRLTGNPILCYNLLFLSTFVLCGLGTFLFVRELTGNRGAAFVAGLAFAFAPYRATAVPHLQVLSAAWMPFTLYGYRRAFESGGHALPLAGASLAWLLQNLSCGYFLFFFAPVVALYLVWELTARRMWTNRRLVIGVLASGAVVTLATLPFLLPYLELRSLGFLPRSIAETQQFSADVYAYFTADVNLRISGSIWRAWPRAEGSLFPGVTIVALALLAGLKAHGVRPAMVIVALLAGTIVFGLLLGYSVREPAIKITSLARALVLIGISGAAWLALSRDLRVMAATWLGTPAGCFWILAIFAMVMSFGPQIHARDRVVLDTNLYALFYRFVPGFDGLRVPARFGMIVALCLAVLCGLGLHALRRPDSLRYGLVLAIAGLLILAESYGVPIPINQNSAGYVRAGLAPLPPLERTPPPVYDYLATRPTVSSVLELPLGEPAFDARYMFFSTRHWRPIVNGYSGGRPEAYELLDQALQDVLIRPDRAWAVLQRSAPASHIVVHERYYAGDRGPQVSAWLRRHGAREIAAFDGDRVFER